jgi:plastocyanin
MPGANVALSINPPSLEGAQMRRLALVLAVVALGAATAAYASSSATTLKLAASPVLLKYNKSLLKAAPGKVTISMSNPSPLKHDVSLKGGGVNLHGKVVAKGGISTITATLKKGTYTFYCTVPGHEAAGMKGKLIVG